MKLSLACLVAMTFADGPDEDRKFTNKPSFLGAEAPEWWSKAPMSDQLDKLEIRIEKYFDKWFPNARVRALFEDHVADVRNAFQKCQPTERKGFKYKSYHTSLYRPN